ncbi:hypothetical protein [Nostoc sp. DedQUE07]|uniref:hypothetical protein n=1 Tax=Nostoc sp. DedQUE07 TaxID=3075392 RepID=UPI00391CCEAB
MQLRAIAKLKLSQKCPKHSKPRFGKDPNSRHQQYGKVLSRPVKSLILGLTHYTNQPKRVLRYLVFSEASDNPDLFRHLRSLDAKHG